MLHRENYIKEIISILTAMVNEVEVRNENKLLDINIFNENFYTNLLNIIFEYNI